MNEDTDIAQLKKISSMVDQELLRKNDILPYLLAGGAGALAGGAATAMQPRGKDESRLKRLYRILRNAALVGGATGGGAALLHNASKRLDTTLSPDDSTVKSEGFMKDKGWLSGTSAGAAGAAMYARGAKSDGKGLGAFIDQTRGSTGTTGAAASEYRKQIATDVAKGGTPERRAMQGKHPDANFSKMLLQNNEAAHKTNKSGVPKFDDALIKSRLRSLGVNPDDFAGASKGSRLMRKLTDFNNTHVGRAFGRTPGARVLRIGGIGAAAAAPYAISGLLERNKSDDHLYE